jgi:hypothetical protein
LQPDDAYLAFNLSVALLLQGRYREAWPLYEQRWRTIMQPRYRERLARPGSGATAFAGVGRTRPGRYLADGTLPAQPATAHPDARITLACQTACLRLFGQLEGITLVPLEDAPPAYDWQIPLMSLPLRLDVTLDTLSDQPYLQADPRCGSMGQACHHASRPVARGHVWETGSWGVGIADHGRQNKSMPLAQFLPLLDNPQVDFVSLQLGTLPDELQGGICAADRRFRRYRSHHRTAGSGHQRRYLGGAPGRCIGQTGVGVDAGGKRTVFHGQGEVSPWYASMRIWRQPHPATGRPD